MQFGIEARIAAVGGDAAIGAATHVAAPANSTGPANTPDAANETDSGVSTVVADDGSADGSDQSAEPNWGTANSQNGGGCSSSSSPVGAGGTVLLSLALLGAIRRRR